MLYISMLLHSAWHDTENSSHFGVATRLYNYGDYLAQSKLVQSHAKTPKMCKVLHFSPGNGNIPMLYVSVPNLAQPCIYKDCDKEQRPEVGHVRSDDKCHVAVR